MFNLLLISGIILITLFVLFGSVKASSKENIQLVAVQMEVNVSDYWSEKSFKIKIEEIMKKIEDEINKDLPVLVVFPEDTGLLLINLGYKNLLQNVNTINSGIQTLSKRIFLQTLWTKIKTGLPWVPSLFFTRNQKIAGTYFNVFSEMAARYEVYLVAGSVILPDYPVNKGKVDIETPPDNKVYNISYLFGPDGSIIGKQKKVNLIDLEKEEALNLNKGTIEELEVFDTELGKIGIAICLDAFEDEVIEKLQEQGADILVQPSANPGAWTREQQLDWLNGSYKRVYLESKFKYGINPMMVGSIWEINFYGQTSIISKNNKGNINGYNNLKKLPGFLKTADSEDKEEIIVKEVPLDF
ncbi:MAG: nitrilase-related carbon-nitrogen hydrolase [Halanaerobiales bacterium]